MTSYRGTKSLKLDAKGRLTFPKGFLEDLQEQCGGRVVFTIHHNYRCLSLYPEPEWDRVHDKLMELPAFDDEAERLRWLLIGHQQDGEVDNQGRLLVPQTLREYANLTHKSRLMGFGSYFQLWDEETWESQVNNYTNTERAPATPSPALQNFRL